MTSRLAQAIINESKRRGADPLDFATLVGFETGNTYDVWQIGPRTKWGEHIGLIQMGEPQRKQFGYHEGISEEGAVKASFDYLEANGWKPGMSLLDMYSTINAGAPGRYNAVDGGTTVRQKVESKNMDGSRRKAAALLGGIYTPIPKSTNGSADIGMTAVEVPTWQAEPPRAPEVQVAETGWWQLQSDAYNREQTLPWLQAQHTGFEADPNWSLAAGRVKTDLEARGIPSSEVERYTNQLASISEADYQNNLGRVKDDWDRGQRLANAGFAGTTLTIANQIFDPVALGADLLASTVAPELVFARRAGRLSGALSGATASAAGGFASAAVAEGVNPHRDQMDLLYGTVLGFGVGGTVGHLFNNPATVAEGAHLQRIAQRAAMEYDGVPLGAGSVGAAKANRAEPFLDEDGLGLLDDRDFAKTFGGMVRPDLSARLQQDKNVLINAAAGLVQDGTGKVNGAINAIAASEDMTRLFDQMRITEARTYNVQLREFSKGRRGGAERVEQEFNSQIDAYIRDRNPGRMERYDPSVVRAGNKQAELYAEALKLQQNPFYREGLEGRAVFGSEGIPTDAHFAPRFWESQRLVLANKDYVDGTVERLIGGAMRSANPTLTEDVLQRTAKAFTKAIVNRAHGLDDVATHTLSAGKLDEVVDMLQSQYGLIKEDAEALRAQFRKSKDAGRDGHNRSRLLLDESYRLSTVMKRDGTADEAGLGISDLISTDARRNFTRYMRSTMGRVALSRYRFKDPRTGELLINGFTSDREFEQYLGLVRQKNADLISQGQLTTSEAATGMKRLEFAYASILGRPTNTMEATNAGWYLRMARKYNFARIMGQVGWAQVSEIGNVVSKLGYKAAFSQAPALRRVLTDDGETILKSGLADDLEALIGVGADRLLQTSNYRLDDLTGIHIEPTARWQDRVEGTLDKLNHFTSEVSGLTQINTMLDRWTAAVIIQKFANMATKGGAGMSTARLADLGLDKAMADRVMTMFDTEGNFEFTKGVISGRKVVRAHFDNWADKEAREAFIQAAHRLSREIIQKHDIGNMAMWMSHPIAKVFLQFRTFMVGAYSKQTLKAANFRDAMVLHQIMLTAGFAAAGYIAQTKIQSIGRSDQDKFLEDRLNPKAIAEAAFSRAAMSSILPMLIDSGRLLVGTEPLFSFTRTTGQASDAWLGNPTKSLADDVAKASASIAGLTEDRPWSQEEARNLLRVMPFANSLPMVMGLNALIYDMPKHALRH